VNVRLQCGYSETHVKRACGTNGCYVCNKWQENDMRGVNIQTMLALKGGVLQQFLIEISRCNNS
jgi:hypothetical protein